MKTPKDPRGTSVRSTQPGVYLKSPERRGHPPRSPVTHKEIESSRRRTGVGGPGRGVCGVERDSTTPRGIDVESDG